MKFYKKIILGSIGLVSISFAPIVSTSCDWHSITFLKNRNKYYADESGEYNFISSVPINYQHIDVQNMLWEFEYVENEYKKNFKNLALFQMWVRNSKLENISDAGKTIAVDNNDFNFESLETMDFALLTLYQHSPNQYEIIYFEYQFTFSKNINANEPIERYKFSWLQELSITYI